MDTDEEKMNLDGLAEKVLDAIEAAGNMQASWIQDKRLDVGTRSRENVIRWICLHLDNVNLKIAAKAIGVSVEDLEATGRVMQKV